MAEVQSKYKYIYISYEWVHHKALIANKNIVLF